jgi:hypothetical protein
MSSLGRANLTCGTVRADSGTRTSQSTGPDPNITEHRPASTWSWPSMAAYPKPKAFAIQSKDGKR